MKATDPFWSDTLRFERLRRSEVGFFVMYYHIEVGSWYPSSRNDHYIPLLRSWAAWEFPKGLLAVITLALPYIGSAVIHNPSSVWWVIYCTG